MARPRYINYSYHLSYLEYKTDIGLNVLRSIFFLVLGKGPLSDHTTNSFEGHFTHVGGTNMVIDESTASQPKIARLVSNKFMPPNDTNVEPEQCRIVFYYYNLGIPSEAGQMKLTIAYVDISINETI